MNRTPSGLSNSFQPKNHRNNKRKSSLNISKTIQGFMQYKGAEGLRPRSLESYDHDLNLWLEIQGDRDLKDVTTQTLCQYLNYMHSEYIPRRITGNNEQKLSGKNLRNIWVSLSAFFSWASKEFDFPNPMRGVLRNPEHVDHQIRNKPSTQSGACRPLFR